MAEGSALIAALRAASPSAEAAPQAQSFQTLSFPWQRNAPATPSPVMQSPMPVPAQTYTPPPRVAANSVDPYTEQPATPQSYYNPYNYDFSSSNPDETNFSFTAPIDYQNPAIPKQNVDPSLGYNMPDYTNPYVYYAQYNDADPALWNLY